MGWFGSSKPDKPDVSRHDRQQCWSSRDAYFACLDQAGVLTPGEEGKTCAPENAKYEQNCARSWIGYFNKRRVLAERQKDVIAQANAQARGAKSSPRI